MPRPALLEMFAATTTAATPPSSFNAAAWGTVLQEFDFSDTSKITASGGAVSAVASKSGSWGASLAQSTGAQKPTTGTRSATGGKNVLDFDGADVLSGTAGAGYDTLYPYTLALVVQSDNTASVPERDATGYNHPIMGQHNAVYAYWHAQWMDSSVTVTTAWRVLVADARTGGATSRIYVDGVSSGTATNLVNGCGSTIYIGGQAGGANGWDGCIGHYLLYAGTVSDIPGMSAALKTYWGI